jgi:hypothetical protein
MHKVGMFVLDIIFVLLKSLQELGKSLLGDFTPSSF